MTTLRRVLRIVTYTVLSLMALLLLLLGLTQTGFFKEHLRTIISSNLSTRLNGSLSLGAIRGNFFTGFSVDSVAILQGSEVVFSAGSVTLEYDPLLFLKRRLDIKRLVIEKPIAAFRRSTAGEWNFQKLLKSSGTPGEGSFDWTIMVDDFRLSGGTLSLVDSASLIAPDHPAQTDSSVEYHNFRIEDLTMNLRGVVAPELIEANIRHLSFHVTDPEFRLVHLKGDVHVDPTGISANKMLVQTSHSTVEVDASMKGLDIFRRIDLAAMAPDSTRLHLLAKSIDLNELALFIPEIAFLNGSAYVECRAEGQFGNLNLEELRVQSRQSTIQATGTLRNLHHPEELSLNVGITDTRVEGSDVAAILPKFHLPDLGRAGRITLDVQFAGKPLDFKATTSLKGKFGEVQISGTMNLADELPKYTCTFSTRDLNLRNVLEEVNLTTSISALGTLTGEGFSLDTLSSNLFLNIDSSKIQDLVLKVGQINLHALPHHLDVSSSFHALDMGAALTAHTDFLNTDHPRFEGDLTLTSFDVAALLNDSSYKSDLTLHTTFDGSGRTIDDVSGNIDLTLQSSSYQDRALSPLQLALSLDQRDAANKHLSVRSSLANVEVDGKFDLDVAAAAIANLSSNLVTTLEEHASPPSSVSHRPISKVRIPPHTASQRAMDFTYKFTIFNLEPVSSFVGGKQFNAHGTVSGSISGSDEQLSVSSDASIEEFFLGTVNDGIFLNNSNISLTATNLTPDSTLETLSAKAEAHVGKGLFGSRTLSDARMSVAYDHLKGTFTFAGAFDSLYHLSLGGQSSIQPNTYVFDLDSLHVGSSQYSWTNDQDIQTRLDYEGFRVMHAVLRRSDESLSFTGAMKHSGEINFAAALRRFDLAGLDLWLQNPGRRQSAAGLGGTLDADARFSGTLDAPTIALSAIFNNISVRQTHIGTAIATLNYVDSFANIDINVKEFPADSSPTLLVKGRVPINLSFKTVDHRFPDEQQELSVISQGFDLTILGPFIPDLQDLHGKLSCNVSIRGTPRDPQYGGTISLHDVECIFGPNNIRYIVNGDLAPSGNTVALKDVTVKNPPAEVHGSDARFTGSLTIKDFRVASFDLTAFGRLLLMTDETRKTMPSFYGLLFTEIDPQGLTLRGTPEKPFLSGSLSILNADLEYPPTAASVRGKGTVLNYVLVDDTSKARPDTLTFSSKFYQSNDTAAVISERLFRRTRSSFVDRLRYNLVIDTKGTTSIKMIFTPSTNEELYAELEGKVNAINDQGTATIYGDITVLPRSYYNFFKRFDATGSIRFVGPWDNPVLDIDAAYEGYSQYVSQRTSGQTTSEEEQKSGQQKVIVKLKITGTRYEPKLAMNMQIQRDPNQEPEDYATVYKGGDVQSDAISFILTGKFRDELSSRERENIATNFGSIGVSGLTSNLLSSIFTDFLRKEFPFIRSAEVSYEGGSLQESANLRLSGEAFNGYFRFGGKIFNDINNANVSYQLSLGRMLNVQSIRNLFIELERKVEGSDLTEDKRLTNNARLYYRISF